MQLYLLRHAHAEDAYAKPDDQRILTDEGHANARGLANYLSQIGVRVDALYTSPRVRALQTAEHVASTVGQPAVIREELNYGFSVGDLSALVGDIKSTQSAMLVGHEPTFSAALANLTGARLEMKKCGLARIEITQRDPWRGTLVWLLAPRLLAPFIEE